MIWKKSPRRHAEEGATAVEAAVTISALLFLVLGAVQFGIAYWNWNTMLLAVEEAGRYAMLYNTTNFPNGPPGCNSGLAACAIAWANTQNMGNLFTIRSSVPGAGQLTFTATYTFNFVTTISLQRQVTVPVI